MKVRFTIDALAHVARIHRFIEEHSADAAHRITSRIFFEADRIGRFSHIGHVGTVMGTFEWTVSGLPYVIVFERASDQVVILAVFHTRQARLK